MTTGQTSHGVQCSHFGSLAQHVPPVWCAISTNYWHFSTGACLCSHRPMVPQKCGFGSRYIVFYFLVPLQYGWVSHAKLPPHCFVHDTNTNNRGHRGNGVLDVQWCLWLFATGQASRPSMVFKSGLILVSDIALMTFQ